MLYHTMLHVQMQVFAAYLQAKYISGGQPEVKQ